MADQPVLGESIRRTWRANIDYYRTLGGLTTEFVRNLGVIARDILEAGPGSSDRPARGPADGAIRIRPGMPRPARGRGSASMAAEDAGPPPPALVLEAESGGMAGGVFVVGNKLPREVTAPVEVSAFVAPDHPEVKPTLRIEPERVVLQPGGQMLVQVWASVDDSLEADVSYHANVRVPGMSDEAIPLILRRRATAQVADSTVAASTRPGSARRGRRVQPAKTGSKGT